VRTIEPDTLEAAAAALAEAAGGREPIVLRGGGTKPWAPASASDSIVLSTRLLNRVVAHRHGDLTATVEAGAVLADINRTVAQHGQWIPLDPPWSDRATIGGIVAANDSGPRRHRYGAPRDLIIGVEIARADGIRARAGGIVVKNVAGYDLGRLMTGSFGSLGLILTATFKLYPVPPESRTIAIDLPSTAAAGALVQSLTSSQLTPTAIEIQSPPLRLLVRFESTAASVEQQCAQVAALASAARLRAMTFAGSDEAREWSEHGERPWRRNGAVVKATLLPSALPRVLDAIAETAHGADSEVIGRAGMGVLLIRFDGDTAQQASAIEFLRKILPPPAGSVVVLRGSPDLLSRVGRWGPIGGALRVMQAMKREFDPNGVLNPGGLYG
jgi:glycolate oxidase FAD binding subunit